MSQKRFGKEFWNYFKYILFSLIYLLFSSDFILKRLNLDNEYKNLNLHIFFSSIIYPTIIYYLGTRSNEIFFILFGFDLFFHMEKRIYHTL